MYFYHLNDALGIPWFLFRKKETKKHTLWTHLETHSECHELGSSCITHDARSYTFSKLHTKQRLWKTNGTQRTKNSTSELMGEGGENNK